MIKLDRVSPPIQLSPDFIEQETYKYKNKGESVWNTIWLKKALLQSSHNKCAYCECNIVEESKYLEVEHFYCKKDFPDKVLEWNNLLPSCKRCNGKKGSHSVQNAPIVNPYDDTPQQHMYLENYRLKNKDDKGRTTIDVLDLNDTERLVNSRYKVGNRLQELLENIKDKLDEYKNNTSVRNKNKLIRMIEEVLKSCQVDREYSAVCSTILHKDKDYKNIKNEMENLGLWSVDMEKLHRNSFILILA
ncbi:HNH endonuclease [Capnocytophaga canimorsus]|uniref:HNH endonuclease n=1 Tax=Capnocytophaga canimorsus TaxID=28188 RepID=A0A250G1T0_9FLAO|nr:HNH endonuclease [Capnocytophaga canimorsus]ATA91360.1 HNH endonuclease [Capnocytophaga canimorsus]